MRICVADGGGMAASYVGGILMGFWMEGCGPEIADMYFGTSGGGFDLTYHVIGRMPQGARMWIKHLPAGFVKPGLYPRFDLAYLERMIRYSPDGIDAASVKAAKQKIWIPITHIASGEAKFYCLNEAKDPHHLLLCGCRMPWDKMELKIDGEVVCDGGLLCQPPLEFAETHNPTEIWLLMPFPLDYRVSSHAFYIASWILGRGNREIRKLIRECAGRENKLREVIAARTDLKIVCPKTPLPVNWRTSDPEAIKLVFNQGILDGKRFIQTY